MMKLTKRQTSIPRAFPILLVLFALIQLALTRSVLAAVPASVIVSPTSGLVTSEDGGEATFTVRLSGPPTQTGGQIIVFTDDFTEATTNVTTLSFNQFNWSQPQTVVVTGLDDDVIDGDVAYTISVEDFSNRSAPLVTVFAVNKDNDTASFIVSPQLGLSTTEGGGTDTFSVRLSSQPSANVTTAVSSSDTSEGTVSTSTVTFTSSNWNTAQTVTISGVNDDVDDDDQLYNVMLAPALSSDSNYNGVNPSDVVVSNVDNDTAGVSLSQSSGLSTSEAGASDSFTVRLKSRPLSSVSIPISSSDSSEGTVSPSSVTFSTSNWNSPQTVTVSGVNDNVDDGNQNYSVRLATASSGDPKYNGLNPADVAAMNSDNDTAGFTIDPVSGLTTTEAGGIDTFTVRLNSEPVGSVLIPLSSSDDSEGTITPSSLTFTASNWNAVQTVTATGVDDMQVDGTQTYFAVLSPVSSLDSNYSSLTPNNVSIMNSDNDAVGITVSPTSGLATGESGSADSFTIVLNSQPTANVTIGISSSDTSEGVVSPSSVTFTVSNWSIPKVINVTGVDDAVDDGDIGYTIVTAAVSSNDSDYNGRNPSDVSVVNGDDDTARIAVSPTALVTGEDGSAESFTVVLESQPTNVVLIQLVSSDSSEGTISPDTITFSIDNWNTPRTINVTGVDDNIDDDNVFYTVAAAAITSADPNYSDAVFENVGVLNIDNDTAGITVNPTGGLVTDEAGAASSFTVVLDSEPTANVSIAMTSNDSSEGTISPLGLVFSPVNWMTPKTVTVSGVDDNLCDGDNAYRIALASATSADSVYSGIDPADVGVTNIDNDSASAILSQTSGLETAEDGSADSFTLRLTCQPTANVTFPVRSNDLTEARVSAPTVTFTPGNWNVPKTVNVIGQDDDNDDGDIEFITVVDSATSADANFNGFNPPNVRGINIDNDEANIKVTPTDGLTTSENGSSAQFTVVLASQPSANVRVAISSDDLGEGTVSPASLTFTPDNWDASRTVTVVGVDDEEVDGNVEYTVVLAAATSSDATYSGFNPDDVSVTNVDNDAAGIIVNPTAGLLTSESGSSAEFTLALTSQPTANVSLSLSSSDTSEGVVTSNTVMFTPADWGSPKAVTVSGQNDDIEDGDVDYTIVIAASTSSDDQYDGIDPPDVDMTNVDNDVAGITVIPTSGLTTNENGASANFSVVLTSEPMASVTIPIESEDTTEGIASQSQLTFTETNWDTPQTVIISGVDDSISDGPIAYSIRLGRAASSDLVYAAIDPADVSVVNNDNDTAGITVNPTAGLETAEDGRSALFTVVLNSQPNANVTIAISSSDSSEGSVAPSSVTFSSSNWQTPQTIVVTGENDNADDGDIVYTVILAAASSADAAYNGLDADDVSVVNIDDDETASAGIEVKPQSGLITNEDGLSDSFSVVLSKEPLADVRIAVNSSDVSEGTLDINEIVFTKGNWNVEQKIEVFGVDDALQDGNIAYTVKLGPASSDDDNFSGLDAPDVSVVNQDNEQASSDSRLFIPLLSVAYSPFVNGDFEAGDLRGWTASGQMGSRVVGRIDTDGQTGSATAAVLNGAFSAEINSPTTVNDNIPVGFAEIRQTISVPVDVSQLSLRYRIFTHDVIFSDDRNLYFDTFEVYINNTSVTSSQRDTRCRNNPGDAGTNASGLLLCDGKESDPTRNDPPSDRGVQSATLDVSSHAGQTIELIIRVYNRVDNKYNTWAYVDAVEFD